MGGGGGDNEIKETEYEKAAAEIAGKYWDIYDTELKQFEDTFIQRVDSFNSESNMADTKKAVDLGYNKAFSESRDATAKGLSAAGVDPSSGKFKASMSDISTEQSVAQTDTINRAQASEQDKYVAGLSDVAAIGMGQQASALSGIGDVANMSLRDAKSDAYDDFNHRAGNLQLAGAAAGIGLRSYNQINKAPASSMNSVNMNPSFSRQQNNFYNPNVNPSLKQGW